MIGVAAAEADVALHRAPAVGRDDEDEGAAGLVVEGAVGDEQSRGGIAQGQPDLQGLAAVEIAGLAAEEPQIDVERAVPHLRIDFGDARLEALATDVDAGELADLDAAEIEFVDAGDELVVAGAVDLAEALAALQRLADLDRESGELAVDRRLQVERVEAGAGDAEALAQRRVGRTQLGELARLEPLVRDLGPAQHLRAPRIGEIFVLAVVEGLGGDEALVGERLLHLELAPRLLGGELRLD